MLLRALAVLAILFTLAPAATRAANSATAGPAPQAGPTKPGLYIQGWTGFGLETEPAVATPNRWTNVNVRLANTGPSLHGELRIEVNGQRGQHASAVEVDLPNKTDKLVQIPFFVPPMTPLFDAVIYVEGKERARETFSAVIRPPSDPVILLLARQDIAPKWVSSFAQRYIEATGNRESDFTRPPKAIAVVSDPALLTPNLETLHSIDAIVWDGAPLRNLQPGIVETLRDWVETGGVFIAALGSNTDVFMASELAPLLPAKSRGQSALDFGDAGKIPAALLVPDDGAQVWLDPRDKSTPRAVWREHGRGRVVALATGLSTPKFESDRSLAEKLALWLRPSPAYIIDELDETRFVLLQAEHDRRFYKLIARRTVVIWTVCYLILVGPLAYAFFRYRRRAERAWQFGAVCAAAACGFLYWRGPLSQSGPPITVESFSCAERVGDGDLWRVTSGATIRSTRARTIAIAAPEGAGGMLSPDFEHAGNGPSFMPGSPGNGAPGQYKGVWRAGDKPTFEFRLPPAAARSLVWTAWVRRPDRPVLKWNEEKFPVGLEDTGVRYTLSIAAEGSPNAPTPVIRPGYMYPSGFVMPSDLTFPRLGKLSANPAGAGLSVGSFTAELDIAATYAPFYGMMADPKRTVALQTTVGELKAINHGTLLDRPAPLTSPPPVDRWDAATYERAQTAESNPAPLPLNPEPVADPANWWLKLHTHVTQSARIQIIPEPFAVTPQWLLQLYPRGFTSDASVEQQYMRGSPPPASPQGPDSRSPVDSIIAPITIGGMSLPIPIDPARPVRMRVSFEAELGSDDSATPMPFPEISLVGPAPPAQPAGEPKALKPRFTIERDEVNGWNAVGHLPLICPAETTFPAVQMGTFPATPMTTFGARGVRGRVFSVVNQYQTSPPVAAAHSADTFSADQPHYTLRLTWPPGIVEGLERNLLTLRKLKVELIPCTPEEIAETSALIPGEIVVRKEAESD